MEKRAIFLIDVDNTLLDNDCIKAEIKKSLIKVLGEKEANHFWFHHDKFREDKKLIDFPNIIRVYCSQNHKDICELTLSNIFDNIEFTHALYPKAIEVLNHLKKLGKVILFTEGDNVYQRKKIQKSNLENFVDEVLLFEDKWEHLDKIISRYKGKEIVLIDDKAGPLIKAKQQFPDIFTIEVCQGHYANDDHIKHAQFDKTVNSIAELLNLNPKGVK